ncbi:DUF6233 domain-containing protein [Streptomyces sp. NPDC051578]|uniref:DUF6233 domain-containing protein n=1 Tax=Streptomyces sp. NPDC051578 TaxID=3365662 RepID=UPI0037906382
MSDRSDRLAQLRFLERVQLHDLQRTRDWIAAEERHLAVEATRLPSPPPPDWLIERSIGAGRLPMRVHSGDCWDASKRCKSATADQVRRALVEGVQPCPHCRPDSRLGVLD